MLDPEYLDLSETSTIKDVRKRLAKQGTIEKRTTQTWESINDHDATMHAIGKGNMKQNSACNYVNN